MEDKFLPCRRLLPSKRILSISSIITLGSERWMERWGRSPGFIVERKWLFSSSWQSLPPLLRNRTESLILSPWLVSPFLGECLSAPYFALYRKTNGVSIVEDKLNLALWIELFLAISSEARWEEVFHSRNAWNFLPMEIIWMKIEVYKFLKYLFFVGKGGGVSLHDCVRILLGLKNEKVMVCIYFFWNWEKGFETYFSFCEILY